jgi:hypothetical protein
MRSDCTLGTALDTGASLEAAKHPQPQEILSNSTFQHGYYSEISEEWPAKGRPWQETRDCGKFPSLPFSARGRVIMQPRAAENMDGDQRILRLNCSGKEPSAHGTWGVIHTHCLHCFNTGETLTQKINKWQRWNPMSESCLRMCGNDKPFSWCPHLLGC